MSPFVHFCFVSGSYACNFGKDFIIFVNHSEHIFFVLSVFLRMVNAFGTSLEYMIDILGGFIDHVVCIFLGYINMHSVFLEVQITAFAHVNVFCIRCLLFYINHLMQYVYVMCITVYV